MRAILKFDEFESDSNESKKDKWIAGAISKKGEGSLRKHFGKKEDEKITKTEIDKELSKLHKADQDPDTPGDQLPAAKAKLKKRLVLAKTLSGLGEGHNEMQNYMFFQNIQNIHHMTGKILEMDPHEVDALLSQGHGWAVDHIATSKDDIEEVKGWLCAELGHEGEETEPEAIVVTEQDDVDDGIYNMEGDEYVSTGQVENEEE